MKNNKWLIRSSNTALKTLNFRMSLKIEKLPSCKKKEAKFSVKNEMFVLLFQQLHHADLLINWNNANKANFMFVFPFDVRPKGIFMFIMIHNYHRMIQSDLQQMIFLSLFLCVSLFCWTVNIEHTQKNKILMINCQFITVKSQPTHQFNFRNTHKPKTYANKEAAINSTQLTSTNYMRITWF